MAVLAFRLAAFDQVTFYDDFSQFGTLVIGATGASRGTAVVFGEFSGSGGFIGGGDLYALGDLRPGASPSSVLFDGNLFLGHLSDVFIELGGTDHGLFDQLVVTGNLGLAGRLWVDHIDGFRVTRNQQFLIADIGGTRSGQFAGLSEGSYVGLFGPMPLYITYQADDGNDIALFSSAIPEPNVSLVLVLALILAGRRNKKRADRTMSR